MKFRNIKLFFMMSSFFIIFLFSFQNCSNDLGFDEENLIEQDEQIDSYSHLPSEYNFNNNDDIDSSIDSSIDSNNRLNTNRINLISQNFPQTRELNQIDDSSTSSIDNRPIPQSIDEAVRQNVACEVLFTHNKQFAYTSEFHFTGIGSDILIGNVGEVRITGISDNIMIDGAQFVDIKGIHGSVCVKANEVDSVTGVNGHQDGDIAIISASSNLGQANTINGISRSDIVIKNFNVKRIIGVKRNIYVYGGTIDEIVGITEEIHLFGDAHIKSINTVAKKIVIHDQSTIGHVNGIVEGVVYK